MSEAACPAAGLRPNTPGATPLPRFPQSSHGWRLFGQPSGWKRNPAVPHRVPYGVHPHPDFHGPLSTFKMVQITGLYMLKGLFPAGFACCMARSLLDPV